ncbi:helix-turn-helix domain-containing protein [Blautia producta]|uniref:Helix-turn-helix conjugative transposon-like domain-containing protein n=1 Tax=Blautia producta TaxID=33035 RepID=A0A4P6LWJ3_9FIRM|nr:helix-turn-helix domain-containing protein [Blautia producta]QBE95187.1 hypothetical protein PMF13cell1_00690 [Blautia producta]
MNFETILQQAKDGNETAIMEIVEMYKPLLIKNAIEDGVFDEDLYQELIKVLLTCINGIG